MEVKKKLPYQVSLATFFFFEVNINYFHLYKT